MSSIHTRDCEEVVGMNSSGCGLDVNPMDLFAQAEKEGRPLYCAAPMVRYSKLAFRQTVAAYGVDLTWTPMILAKEFNRSVLARDSDFTLPPPSQTHPTIAQLAANSPLELSRCITLLAPWINGIDLNCGCPQSWACHDLLGAALMSHPTLVASLVSAAKKTFTSLGYTNKTVSVKIRIHKDIQQTIKFVQEVEEAGVDFITVHGRTRSTRSSVPVDLEGIRRVREHANVPVLANGDCFDLEGVRRIVEMTGVQGVMSARGLLEWPGLFAALGSKGNQDQNQHRGGGLDGEGEHVDGEGDGDGDNRWEVLETFMNNVVRAPIPFKLVVHHLSEMVGSDRSQSGKATTLFSKEERAGLMECKTMLEVIDFVDGVREVRRF